MSKGIYETKQWWTIIFILIAAGIIITTVVVSNSFSAKLAQDERNRVEIWGEAMHILTSDLNDSTQITNLILRILESNNSIPVIVCDENGDVVESRNIEAPDKNKELILSDKMKKFKSKNKPITIQLSDDIQYYLYYDESLVLKRLTMYPYIQLAIVFIFIVVSFLALISTKKAEQNKVWVGLSKETAHQLGTPISSLMAWVEYLKTKDVDGMYLKEIEKDVKRLEMIADRFSKIGSKPDLLPLDINKSLKSSCEYMSARISSKVVISVELPEQATLVLMNDSLFSWVIENLTNNAVDAISGQGNITYHVENNQKKIFIDVTDTGKGIAKSRFKTIFKPGYTTKTRGWGLGLSLVKRIIESYPGGKIYVKSSELGKGATFRIELRKYHK
jgi:signal transduction histidine kinase